MIAKVKTYHLGRYYNTKVNGYGIGSSYANSRRIVGFYRKCKKNRYPLYDFSMVDFQSRIEGVTENIRQVLPKAKLAKAKAVAKPKVKIKAKVISKKTKKTLAKKR